jgi:hypothetical protein
MSTDKEFDKYDDELNSILKEFHATLFDVIKYAEKIDPHNANIAWVKDQIFIVHKLDKENIIKRVQDKFWHYRQEIMDRNIEFFTNNQFSQFIKNDQHKSFMYSFVNMIKKKVLGLSEPELNILWTYMEVILKCCVAYKKLIRDYDE